MMNQTNPQVNSITVNEVRVSLIQFMPAMALLQTRLPPSIPFSFLLSGARFRENFGNALRGEVAFRPPWRDSYGKLFWERYIPKESRVEDAAWRLLVPLDYVFASEDPGHSLENCKLQGRYYLYPWGVGLIADIEWQGRMPLFDTVDH